MITVVCILPFLLFFSIFNDTVRLILGSLACRINHLKLRAGLSLLFHFFVGFAFLFLLSGSDLFFFDHVLLFSLNLFFLFLLSLIFLLIRFFIFILLITDLFFDHADTALELELYSHLLYFSFVFLCHVHKFGSIWIHVTIKLVYRVKRYREVPIDVCTFFFFIKLIFILVNALDKAIPVGKSLIAFEGVDKKTSTWEEISGLSKFAKLKETFSSLSNLIKLYKELNSIFNSVIQIM